MTLLKVRPGGAPARERRLPVGRLVALLVLVGVCWAILAGTTPSPGGNPVLRTTSPGSTELVKSPDNVVLTFDRPVPAGLATVRILDPDGSQVVFDRPVHPDGHDDMISVPMPKERHEGTYVVSWAMPSDTLEPIGGSFTFDVFSTIEPEGVPEIETTHDPVVTAVYTTFRVAALGAMVLLAGAAIFVAVAGSGAPGSRPVRRLVKCSWWVLVAATAGTLVSFGPYAAWAPLRDAFDPRLLSGTFESATGGALLARLYLLVPATLGLAQLMTSEPADTRRERALRAGAVLGCAAALLATWTLADPRPAGAPGPSALAADILLLGALAAGAGGLVLLRLSGVGEHEVVARFARLSLWCAGILVVAGTYQVWSGSHRFGWLTAGSLALAVLLVAFAILSRKWTRADENASKRERRTDLRRFRLRITGTAGVAGLIVAATGALVTLQPGQTAHAQGPTDPAPAAIREQVAPTRLTFDTGKPGGQGSVDLVLIPVTTGQTVHVDTRVSTIDDGGHARDDVAVFATLTHQDSDRPVPLPLNHAGAGYLAGSATLPERGGWQLALTLRTTDGGTQTLTQPLYVQ
ncbi:MAG TPA: copper resistance protein CopC [Amycolatopsis sp.]|nr:copper resistance protein CopC [Amycolatopsis sp.]